MSSKVRDILKTKGPEVYTIAKNATVLDAVEKMTEKGVGSLVVLDADNICGIVTERDYLRKVVIKGESSSKINVSEIMTSKIIYADPELTTEECMAIMTEARIRHLPVIDDGKLTGLISIGDLIKQVSRDQKVTIQYLTDYITGKYPV